jgi:malonyl-CoA O-methyltransferase
MINNRFGEVADVYHKEAEIPRKVAEGLISSLLPWRETIPDGPILEVGCGSGFLTELLINHFPEKEFIITDGSAQMLNYCERRLSQKGIIGDQNKIRFQLLDADDYTSGDTKYGLVISNFSAHWFKDISISLEEFSKDILPGGLLLCSVPGEHSFEQWYENCLELGLPHTANPLPNVEEVVIKLSTGPLQLDYYENDLYQEFNSSLDFFRHLKKIGSNIPFKNNRLDFKQFKLLTQHWDNKSTEILKVKWHIVYLAAKKEV